MFGIYKNSLLKELFTMLTSELHLKEIYVAIPFLVIPVNDM